MCKELVFSNTTHTNSSKAPSAHRYNFPGSFAKPILSPEHLPDTTSDQFAKFDSDAIEGQIIVVGFICNHCPYVIRFAERLAMDLNALQAQGVGVAAIMSNDYDTYPADAPDKMATFAQRHGFDFPYLVDTDQSVPRAFGAVCTPDFFGLNAELRLQYRGRLDDLKMGASGERNAELLEAMRQIAQTGAGPAEQTPSIGCSIKWRAQ